MYGHFTIAYIHIQLFRMYYTYSKNKNAPTYLSANIYSAIYTSMYIHIAHCCRGKAAKVFRNESIH